jgi:hypothetical protein
LPRGLHGTPPLCCIISGIRSTERYGRTRLRPRVARRHRFGGATPTIWPSTVSSTNFPINRQQLLLLRAFALAEEYPDVDIGYVPT